MEYNNNKYNNNNNNNDNNNLYIVCCYLEKCMDEYLQWRCNDKKQCIWRRSHCDGRVDCDDRSDEANCDITNLPPNPKRAYNNSNNNNKPVNRSINQSVV